MKSVHRWQSCMIEDGHRHASIWEVKFDVMQDDVDGCDDMHRSKAKAWIEAWCIYAW